MGFLYRAPFLLIMIFGLYSCVENKRGNDNFISSGIVKENDVRRELKEDSKSRMLNVGVVKTESNKCTGTVISKRHILTAAHCIFDKDTGQLRKGIDFIPGVVEEKTPLLGDVIQRVWFPKNYEIFLNDMVKNGKTSYLSREASRYDYAILEASFNIGDEVGFSKVKYKEGLSSEFLIKMLSYPGDKPDYTLWLEFCLGEIDRNDLGFMLTECSTHGGSSGSALFIQSYENEPFFIRGVHITGNEESKINRSVYFSRETVRDINRITSGRGVPHSFKSVNVNLDNRHVVLFENKCSDEISIAVGDPRVSGEDEVKGYYFIKPGQKRENLLKIKGREYYLYSYNRDDRIRVLEGSDLFAPLYGRTIGLRKFTAPKGRAYYVHQIHCEDMN